MSSILLIGNGFTSYLIHDYKNEHMMSKVKEVAPEILKKADDLFTPFRKKTEPLLYDAHAAGYCGQSVCGGTSFGGPISGLLYNPALTKYIETQLEELGFHSSKSLLTDYFETFGLINETQHDSISNLESLLKIIDLFSKIGEFSNVDRSAIEKMANIVYFNDGNCGAQGIEKATQERISSAFAEYKEIYTTNYDTVLDERVPGKEIRHLHGGFLYDDKTHRSDMIVQPEKAVLIWGITGEEKQKKMTAKFSFPISYPMEYPISLFSRYLNELENIDADSIDIFGYSGENDQHINRAISNNPHIKKVNYYCAPQEVDSERYEFKVKSLFGIDAKKELQLISWEKMWEVLKVNC